MSKNPKNETKRPLHIDFEETSAIPEIHVGRSGSETEQRPEEKEGGIRIIKEGVAVPEVMKIGDRH